MGRGRASFGSSRSSKKMLKDDSRKFENGVVDEETWDSSKHYGSLIGAYITFPYKAKKQGKVRMEEAVLNLTLNQFPTLVIRMLKDTNLPKAICK